MKKYGAGFSRIAVIGAVVLCCGWLALAAPPAGAAPFTTNFDALIADLEARAGVLSNSTNKVEQKQFKTIQQVLKTLNGKMSTSLTTEDNGFSFAGSCQGSYFSVASELLLTGQNTLLTSRSITLAIVNPTGPGTYPVGPGSLYTDEKNGGTIYQNDVAGTVTFTTLDIAHGLAEGTFTFSAGQTTPPDANTVTVINGHFKNSNITSQ